MTRLKLTQDQANQLFYDMVTPAAIVGMDHQFLAINSALERLLGYPEAYLVGRKYDEITPNNVELESDNEQLEKVVSGERSGYTMKKDYYSAMQTVVKTMLTVSRIEKSDGKLAYFFSQIQEINPQIVALQERIDYLEAKEAERQEARKRFWVMLRTNWDSFWTWASNNKVMACVAFLLTAIVLLTFTGQLSGQDFIYLVKLLLPGISPTPMTPEPAP